MIVFDLANFDFDAAVYCAKLFRLITKYDFHIIVISGLSICWWFWRMHNIIFQG